MQQVSPESSRVSSWRSHSRHVSVLQFFNNALMVGKTSESDMSGRVFELIYELNMIAPALLLAVLPQLEFKLKVGRLLVK